MTPCDEAFNCEAFNFDGGQCLASVCGDNVCAGEDGCYQDRWYAATGCARSEMKRSGCPEDCSETANDCRSGGLCRLWTDPGQYERTHSFDRPDAQHAVIFWWCAARWVLWLRYHHHPRDTE